MSYGRLGLCGVRRHVRDASQRTLLAGLPRDAAADLPLLAAAPRVHIDPVRADGEGVVGARSDLLDQRAALQGNEAWLRRLLLVGRVPEVAVRVAVPGRRKWWRSKELRAEELRAEELRAEELRGAHVPHE